MQLTLQQHRFELHRYTYLQIFFNNILEIFDNLEKLTDELCSLKMSKKLRKRCHKCIKHMQVLVYLIIYHHKINSRLLVVNSGGTQELYADFQLWEVGRVGAPNPPFHCSRVNCN